MLKRGILKEDVPAMLYNLYPDLLASYWAFADIIEASVAHDYRRMSDGWEIWTHFNAVLSQYSY
jgi:hypothetical protein